MLGSTSFLQQARRLHAEQEDGSGQVSQYFEARDLGDSNPGLMALSELVILAILDCERSAPPET